MQKSTVERYADPEIEAAVARIEVISRLMDDLFEIRARTCAWGSTRSSGSCR